MMTDDEIIAVVTAHKEGKQIQSRRRFSFLKINMLSGETNDATMPFWRDDDLNANWNFEDREYRVKPNAPEPRKPREWWIDPVKWSTDKGNVDGWIVTNIRSCNSIRVREVIEE